MIKVYLLRSIHVNFIFDLKSIRNALQLFKQYQIFEKKIEITS